MFAPYLFFGGECAAAFDLYRDIFGGEFASRAAYSDAPPEMKVADAHRGRIMHVTLASGGAALLGCDVIPGDDNYGPLSTSGCVSIMHEPKSRADADRIFARLCEGGEVKMPMQEMFWGAYFGHCRDRFGVSWMLNAFLGEKS